MTAGNDTLQCIRTLTPLADVFAKIDALAVPTAIRLVPASSAIGATLAADVLAPANLPPEAVALQDGWAVAAEQVVDASAYSPAILKSTPLWVDAGQPMPANADAVLPVDAIAAGSNTEAIASVAPGEGVLPAGADATKGIVLRKAGARVRPIDAAVFRAMQIETTSVRTPRIGILNLSAGGDRNDFIPAMIAGAVRAAGGESEVMLPQTLEAALAAPGFDAIIGVGGTGAGRNDNAVKSLARSGNVECHGIGVSPGQTAALGSANGRVILLLPGRHDAALAIFLIVGGRLLARLTGSSETESGTPTLLLRKVTSTIGLTEVVFVRLKGEGIEPLGSGVFPLQALSQADGWIVVPAESEGFAAGAMIGVRNLR